jgi:hypothetical protein
MQTKSSASRAEQKALLKISPLELKDKLITPNRCANRVTTRNSI